MSYKPDEKDWMAYLYGELESTEKEKFDHYILENPEARQELEKFQNFRTMLSGVKDKEVIAPPVFIERGATRKGYAIQRPLWSNPYFRMVMSIAASLFIVILAGRLTGTRITVSDREFRLSFGTVPEEDARQPVVTTAVLSPDQVQKMIDGSLNDNIINFQASLQETQTQLDESIRKNLARNSGKVNELVREASTASQQQIREFVDGIRTENMEQVKDYFKLTSTEQKKYIENLLVDFAQYLQQQRNNDLQLVQTRMNSLEQNTDIFKQETEQILSSIITTVGSPTGTETKN